MKIDILQKYVGKYTSGYTNGYFSTYDSYERVYNGK